MGRAADTAARSGSAATLAPQHEEDAATAAARRLCSGRDAARIERANIGEIRGNQRDERNEGADAS
jgi:hypothetical protein